MTETTVQTFIDDAQDQFELGVQSSEKGNLDKALDRFSKGLQILQNNNLMDESLATNLITAMSKTYRAKANSGDNAMANIENTLKQIEQIADHPAARAQVIETLQEVASKAHAQYADSLYNTTKALANGVKETDSVEIKEARYITALDLLNEAFTILKTKLPALTAFQDQFLADIGLLCQKLHVEVAQSYYKDNSTIGKGFVIYAKIYESMTDAFPEGHDMLGVYAANMGIGYTAFAKYPEAEEYYTKSLGLLGSSNIANKSELIDEISKLLNNTKLANAPAAEATASETATIFKIADNTFNLVETEANPAFMIGSKNFADSSDFATAVQELCKIVDTCSDESTVILLDGLSSYCCDFS